MLEYAALSGKFDPGDALAVGGDASPASTAEIASELAMACDINPDNGRAWVMHGPKRRQILAELAASNRLREAVDRRREREMDEATRDLLDALSGLGEFARAGLRDLISNASDRGWIARIATALDRAGELAPAAALLGAVRSVLSAVERDVRREEIVKRGFFGRDDELNDIHGRLATPPATVRAVFVNGLPGIGKSALLEEIIATQFGRHRSLTVRLDFDRAGLDVTEPHALTREVARQLADRIGESAQPLIDARIESAGVQATETGRSLRRSDYPEPLGAAIGRAILDSDRPVLMVVDTFEALQARGVTHAGELFKWLDWLHDCGLKPLRIVVAGRAPPPSMLNRSIGDPIELKGLSDPAARQFLTRLGVSERGWPPVIACSFGNPLALRLAAAILRDGDIGALPRDRLNPQLAAALLYRILLSRIGDDDLRSLAHPGLIVRRISAEMLRCVIAPQIGKDPLDKARATELFEALSRQHWLVERDPEDPDFVRHRSDMRGLLLPLLYLDDPAGCHRIDAAAASWFGRRGDAASALDALYHRLQLLRRGSTRPAVPEALARRFDLATIAELPERAQVLVRQAAGESATAFGLAADVTQGEDLLTRELLAIIDRGDWSEGRHLVERVRETGSIDPFSLLADAVRALWWRSGQWHEARWLLRERDRLGGEDDDLFALPPPLAVVRIEMRGEFGPAGPLLNDPRLWDDLPRSAFENSRLAQYGGWAFRLQVTDPGRRATFGSGKVPDPVEAAMDRWLGGAGTSVTGQALDHAQERLSSLGIRLDHPLPRWVQSQLLASLTPYPELVVNLAQGEREIFRHARAAAHSLIAGPHSPLRLSDALSTSGASVDQHDPISAIVSVGLFSEWAEALAFVSRNANLRSIARAAEAWRRTMAGQWRYGSPPRHWPRYLVDEVLAARIERHFDSPDPRALAFTQLEAWVPSFGSGENIWLSIARRVPGALVAALSARSPSEGAQSLLRLRVPAAFVPPILTLLLHPQTLPEEFDHA